MTSRAVDRHCLDPVDRSPLDRRMAAPRTQIRCPFSQSSDGQPGRRGRHRAGPGIGSLISISTKPQKTNHHRRDAEDSFPASSRRKRPYPANPASELEGRRMAGSAKYSGGDFFSPITRLVSLPIHASPGVPFCLGTWGAEPISRSQARLGSTASRSPNSFRCLLDRTSGVVWQ